MTNFMIPNCMSQLHIPQTTPDSATFTPYSDYSKSSNCHAERITRLERERVGDGFSESTLLHGLGSLRSSLRQLSGQVIHVVISPRISGLLTAREKLSDIMEIHFSDGIKRSRLLIFVPSSPSWEMRFQCMREWEGKERYGKVKRALI